MSPTGFVSDTENRIFRLYSDGVISDEWLHFTWGGVHSFSIMLFVYFGRGWNNDNKDGNNEEYFLYINTVTTLISPCDRMALDSSMYRINMDGSLNGYKVSLFGGGVQILELCY